MNIDLFKIVEINSMMVVTMTVTVRMTIVAMVVHLGWCCTVSVAIMWFMIVVAAHLSIEVWVNSLNLDSGMVDLVFVSEDISHLPEGSGGIR